MKYVFYFDESFHDRKITIYENGHINTLQEEALDDYIGVFWGCERKLLDEYIIQLIDFESKYRNIFGLSKNKELKSEIIKKKNYTYGIRSFNKNALDFYTDLFQMLSKWDYILQINIISKMELLVRNSLQYVKFPAYININAFIYSLTKLIVVHKPKQLIEAMELTINSGSSSYFCNTLKEALKAIIFASEDVERKELSNHAFTEMYHIVELLTPETVFNRKTDFLYHLNFEGLSRLLSELGINGKEIKITIDTEENTFKAAQQFNFKKIKQGKSDGSIQLRLSDLIGGFIGRMIYAIKNDDSMQEKELINYQEIDLDDIKIKRTLNPQWFNLKEIHFNMYRLVYNALIVQHQHYWSTFTMTYNDDTICFYSLLRYIASYENYEQFSQIQPDLHSEYYNSWAIKELSDYYDRM